MYVQCQFLLIAKERPLNRITKPGMYATLGTFTKRIQVLNSPNATVLFPNSTIFPFLASLYFHRRRFFLEAFYLLR